MVAIIPARGGSKGLPRKNVRLLAGKPLIAYSIEAARQCSRVSRVLVTTDDDEIRHVSLAHGAEVLDRPAHLASDTALSQDVVRHVLETLRERGAFPSHFALLQPTSPLRTAGHLDACLERFFASGARCSLSVTEVEHHPYKSFRLDGDELVPLLDERSLSQPRQLLPPVVRQNGAIYVMESELFLLQNSFFVPPALPFYMNKEDSVDIDSKFDLVLSEMMLNERN